MWPSLVRGNKIVPIDDVCISQLSPEIYLVTVIENGWHKHQGLPTGE